MMYYLFAGDNYYPMGGALDYIGTFPSKEKAVHAAAALKFPYSDYWWHIADSKMNIVAKGCDTMAKK